MGIIDDISLKVIDGDVEIFEHKISNLRVAISQKLCLGKLYKKEADHEKRGVESINGKRIVNHDEYESFQSKNWF